MSHAVLIDEIANELGSWPGVQIERRSDGAAVVRYEQLELGVLARDRGVAQLRFSPSEREELVEHGDAEPADSTLDSSMVSHDVHGPADVSAVLELFERRYRDLRGEEEPYSAQAPAASVSDESILGRIETLVGEEHTLLGRERSDAADPQALEDDGRRLQELSIELDRCWDLLRQRRARREMGQDPDEARARDASTVERYLQ